MTFLMLALLAGPVRGMTAMKPVVCRTIEEAKGKTGAELAQAIEVEVMRFNASNYELSALLPGDPPIACFRSMADSSKLPRGAR